MRAFDALLHLSIRVYNLFNTMAFEGQVLASMVHICIIRLLLKPRNLPGEDGGTEASPGKSLGFNSSLIIHI